MTEEKTEKKLPWWKKAWNLVKRWAPVAFSKYVEHKAEEKGKKKKG
jgi:hypothetical protein